MPAVRCVSRYSSDVAGFWEEGRERDVSDAELVYLLNDSPGSFEVIDPVREPPSIDSFISQTSTSEQSSEVAIEGESMAECRACGFNQQFDHAVTGQPCESCGTEYAEAFAPLPASMTATATGVKAPDRRARGGRRRKDE
jgi:hypothetical protein